MITTMSDATGSSKRRLKALFGVAVVLVALTACQPHPAATTPWHGALLDGTYTLFSTDANSPCFAPTGTAILAGQTVTVHGKAATSTGPNVKSLTGSTGRRANVFTIRLSRNVPTPTSLQLHGTVWGATDITGSGEFSGANPGLETGFDCRFTFTAHLTSAHPPCTVSAVKAGIVKAIGGSVTVDVFQCLGPWAVAGWTNNPEAEFTAVLHSKGNTWKFVDREPQCEDGSIPAPISLLACESN